MAGVRPPRSAGK
jgi:hypothetical protein